MSFDTACASLTAVNFAYFRSTSGLANAALYRNVPKLAMVSITEDYHDR